MIPMRATLNRNQNAILPNMKKCCTEYTRVATPAANLQRLLRKCRLHGERQQQPIDGQSCAVSQAAYAAELLMSKGQAFQSNGELDIA